MSSDSKGRMLLNEKTFRDRGSGFIMQKILSDINNFLFKTNINDLISDLKQKNQHFL